jgi:hypothetical protein
MEEWRNGRRGEGSNTTLATASENVFQVLVSGLSGKTWVVDVGQGERVWVLQDYVYHKEGIPSELQVLTVGSKVLLGHQQLGEGGLHHLCTVAVRLRIRGGGPARTRNGQKRGVTDDGSSSSPSAANRTRVSNRTGPFVSNYWKQPHPFQASGSRSQQRAADNRKQRKTGATAKFQNGVKDFIPSLTPAVAKLLDSVGNASDDQEAQKLQEVLRVSAAQVAAARQEEEANASKLLEEWCAGAVGYVPPEVPENAIRGFGENINSIWSGLWTRNARYLSFLVYCGDMVWMWHIC